MDNPSVVYNGIDKDESLSMSTIDGRFNVIVFGVFKTNENANGIENVKVCVSMSLSFRFLIKE